MGVWGRLLHKENNMLSDLKQESTQHLRRLKRKKIDNKDLSDVFGSLTESFTVQKKKNLIKKSSCKSRKAKHRQRQYIKRIPKKYKIYIKSGFWRTRKNNFWQVHGKKCAICKSSKKVDLHHMVYKNYGVEKDEDLMPLCREHHEAFHTVNVTKADMKQATLDFCQEEIYRINNKS